MEIKSLFITINLLILHIIPGCFSAVCSIAANQKPQSPLKNIPRAIKQVEVFGQKINYLETGKGPKIILLHGLGDDLHIWSATVKALASKYQVFAIDQIGCGQSDKPPINYRPQVLVDFLNGFCRKLKIDKATIVGNSLGGWVAAAFAEAHPERVEKLVLVGAAGYWPKIKGVEELTREQLALLKVSSLAAYRETLKWMLYDEQMITDTLVEDLYAAQLKRKDGYTIDQFIEAVLRGEDRLSANLQKIKAPTLIIWGREDEVTPLAIGEALAQEIPNTRKALIDGCGHLPQFECAGAFNAALLKFLDNPLTTAAGR
ncbi:MAG: alpha/beta fold hydrolase [Acidobacteriota bacterium]